MTGRGPHMYLSIQQPRKVVEDGVLLGEREAGERSVTGRGHCSAVEDGVLLGKREAGERSVTGRGPRIRLLSIATTKSQNFFQSVVCLCFVCLFCVFVCIPVGVQCVREKLRRRRNGVNESAPETKVGREKGRGGMGWAQRKSESGSR